jgi:hypothetical protein
MSQASTSPHLRAEGGQPGVAQRVQPNNQDVSSPSALRAAPRRSADKPLLAHVAVARTSADRVA